MNLEEKFKIANLEPIAFVIKGSPDPDAIASSLALLSYYEELGGTGEIICDQPISHPNNKMMINILGLQIQKVDLSEELEKYKYYVICDHCSHKIDKISSKKCLLHIDHHKEAVNNKEEGITQIFELDAGSCSTIIVGLLEKNQFFQGASGNIERIATALSYGIRTDTDNLENAGCKDWEAMKILSIHVSRDDLKKISASRLSTQSTQLLKKAFEEETLIQNWLFTTVGFLQESYRDSIAIVADELIRRSGIDHVFVWAIVEHESYPPTVEGSIRSADSGMDLNAFVKAFSENAGGRKNKAGFQIPLGFWGTCPEKEVLAGFIKKTIESKFKSTVSTEK